MYKISIIIPVFNTDKYIRYALDSIISQTMDLNDLEVIMVDDCSSDNSGKIIDEYSQKYDNFISIHLDENTGSPSIPRNIGIKNASADYIMFLDSDDTYDSEACEFLYNTITEENVDIVSGIITHKNEEKTVILTDTWFQILDDGEGSYNDRRNRVNDLLLSDELFKIRMDSIHDNPLWLRDFGFFNKIYRKSRIIEHGIYFPEDIDGGEDSVFLCNYLINAKGIIYTNKVVTIYYAYRENSLSKSKNLKTIENRPKAYKMMYDSLMSKNVDKNAISIFLGDKTAYWLNVHLFTTFYILNNDIIELIKKYKVIFDISTEPYYDSDGYFRLIFNSIKNENYDETIDLINKKRREKANYSLSVIYPLSKDNHPNDLLKNDIYSENIEYIFIESADLNEDIINKIKSDYLNAKFIPPGVNSINEAIENAISPHVMFISSQNQFDESSLKLLSIIENDKLDVVCQCDSVHVKDLSFKHDLAENLEFAAIYKTEYLINNHIGFNQNEGELQFLKKALSDTYNFRCIDSDSLNDIVKAQQNCKITVIMPVYNAERYLNDSIICILNQTFRNIELICVDDESQDGSLNILHDYSMRDSRIQYYHKTHNGGGGARNFALGKAKGKYIYFMDADDLLVPTALEELYEIIEDSKADLVITPSRKYDSDNEEYIETKYLNMTNIQNKVGNKVFNYKKVAPFIIEFTVPPWGKLFSRELVINSGARFGEGLIFHDNLFFWEFLFNTKKIRFYNKKLHLYRIHSKSSTESKDYRYLDIIDVFNGMFDIFMKYNEFYNREHNMYHYKMSILNFRYGLIQDKYKSAFFDKMKKDLTEMLSDKKYKNMLKLLVPEHKVLLNSVLNANNAKEFELLKENGYIEEIRTLVNKNNSKAEKARKLKKRNVKLQKKTEKLVRRNEKLQKKTEKLVRRNEKLQKKTEKLVRRNEKLQKRNEKLNEDYKSILSSNSFKLTSPLRKIRNFRK